MEHMTKREAAQKRTRCLLLARYATTKADLALQRRQYWRVCEFPQRARHERDVEHRMQRWAARWLAEAERYADVVRSLP